MSVPQRPSATPTEASSGTGGQTSVFALWLGQGRSNGNSLLRGPLAVLIAKTYRNSGSRPLSTSCPRPNAI
jgi:hypothetical protein